jgi:hypothetical protein
VSDHSLTPRVATVTVLDVKPTHTHRLRSAALAAVLVAPTTLIGAGFGAVKASATVYPSGDCYVYGGAYGTGETTNGVSMFSQNYWDAGHCRGYATIAFYCTDARGNRTDRYWGGAVMTAAGQSSSVTASCTNNGPYGKTKYANRYWV